MTQSIDTRSGLKLLVEKHVDQTQVKVLLSAQTSKGCVLHWGIRDRNQSGWRSLPSASWPEGTTAAGPSALQTPFQKHNGQGRVVINLSPAEPPELIEFALFFPEEGRWDNNGRRNYQIEVRDSAPAGSALAALKTQLGSGEILFERAFDLEGGRQLAAGVTRVEGYRLLLLSDMPGPLALHWGVARHSPQEWLQPPESVRPPGTVLCDGQTTQTPFESSGSLNRLEISFTEADAPLGIQFVLKQGPEGRWLKQRAGNFYVPVRQSGAAAGELPAELQDLAGRIVQVEMNSGSWTLMHRFNLCFDLLEAARGNLEALALLYVWLRFSAMRQLTWQRNYNTKPRELAHAQDRLTNRLAEEYRAEPPGRPLLRLSLATVGRGGDGQRIRDEVLQIMHRHHIKEVSGHFLEEWHQKLHNNTTPDDIVICEAYLEFLRSDGNRDRFYQALQKGGVTRERLETFERPIRSHPDFVPHLKDALLHDFENFLKILKAVHSATDLEIAIQAAREHLDGDTQGLLSKVWNHRHDAAEVVGLVQQVTEIRRRLARRLEQGEALRPLLYLDLGLEQLIRVLIERNLHRHLPGEALAQLIGGLLENFNLSYQDAELEVCRRHWERLCRNPPEALLSPGWAQQAKAVVDRIGRALGDWTDRLYRLLQPKAEFLGQAFKAEPWTITLFSEEVVRGSSLGFSLSMLLHQFGHVLREAAHLGTWQIVSPGRGTGQVEVVEELKAVQTKQFSTPVAVIANKVNGDEELPKEVVAVIAPDVTDLVSHVAVRARNARLLFASCADPALLEKLKSLRGHRLHFEVTPAGDVAFREASEGESEPPPAWENRTSSRATRPSFSGFAVTLAEFNDRVVGAKSCSQARLKGKLPDWIRQPASMAIPFGSMEKVLSLKENAAVAEHYQQLVESLSANGKLEVLTELRKLTESLAAPEELPRALQAAAGQIGLAWPEDWEACWGCIKRVWASKWNERAVLSRRRIGIPHEGLFMSVLIQPVVEADYSFVIHTVNPSSRNRNELYAEVVLGLGETLVGNYPGRALSFVWDKSTEQQRLLAYPGKSLGLYGAGLIFRSDSNGEDLAGYAGAGLYDSVLFTPPRRVCLDYSQEPLVWDVPFRNGLLTAIARLGQTVESELDGPQDVEGAVVKGEYFVVQSRPQVGLEAE